MSGKKIYGAGTGYWAGLIAVASAAFFGKVSHAEEVNAADHEPENRYEVQVASGPKPPTIK